MSASLSSIYVFEYLSIHTILKTQMLQICYLQLAATLLFSLSSLRQRDLFPCTHVPCQFPPHVPTWTQYCYHFRYHFPKSELGAYERIDLQASKEKGRPKLSAMEGDLVLTSLVVSLKNAPGFHRKV